MVWYGVVWCGVVWCGVVWCGAVWCGDRVNLEVRQGQLVAVVGQVGAGKSSLLSAILGEMHKVKGSVSLRVCVCECVY